MKEPADHATFGKQLQELAKQVKDGKKPMIAPEDVRAMVTILVPMLHDLEGRIRAVEIALAGDEKS